MTINYHASIRTSHPLRFYRLLFFSWKASLWKAVFAQLLVWLLVYHIISFIYRFALDDGQKRDFERVVFFLKDRMSYLPLEFLMGFFVTIIFNRWNTLYLNIGFIDNIGLMTAEYVRGHNELGRRFRRNILRYSEVGQIMLFRDISMRVRRRFPTLDSVVAAGFLLPDEKKQLEEYSDKGENAMQWVPFRWALELCHEARKLGLIESDYYQTVVLNEIRTFRTNMEWLRNYDWTPFPLIYPTVVFFMVHMHFTVALISRQLTFQDADGKELLDVYFPYMETLEFIFYMGWLKVAETIINPFGEDDDDFEGNALIDRNITMGLMIVDRAFDNPPELRKDQFWNDQEPRLLYTEESARLPQTRFEGSVSHINLVNFGHKVHMMPRAFSVDQLNEWTETTMNGLENKIRRNTADILNEESRKESSKSIDNHPTGWQRVLSWRKSFRPIFRLGTNAVADQNDSKRNNQGEVFVVDIHENGKIRPMKPL
ncbi:unnamed protein product, partial [Mesorhabditis belari]|uniref:Bestrophin homolog n=1 Tax=Mesorhabditis belari TaxID=2138241 RepID=A0AAF3EFT4_9BILA